MKLLKKLKQNKPAYVVIKSTGENVSGVQHALLGLSAVKQTLPSALLHDLLHFYLLKKILIIDELQENDSWTAMGRNEHTMKGDLSKGDYL